MSRGVLFFDQESRTLNLIRSGDRAGLVRLYDDNRRPVVSHVTRNGGSSDDAEDILQESVIIVWERIRTDSFEPQAKLGTFLYGVARNLWLRRLARRRREGPLDVDPETIPDDASGLQGEEGDDRPRRVQQALERLDEPCRTLLLLYYWERLSMAEIAAHLGFANADVAKAKKYQCKEQLRGLVTEADHD